MPLQVEVVCADRKVWSGSAQRVIARTVDGEIGILPGHAPVLAVLAAGEVRILPTDGEAVVASASEGFLSVEHDRVMIVTETAAMVGGAATR